MTRRRRVVLIASAVALVALVVWLLLPSNEGGIVFAAPGGTPLTLDLDYPSGPGPHPVVLFAPHRGDWGRSFKRDDRCRILVDNLTRNGFAVATMHYRLVGEYRFPSQIEDGKAAVRWLRANGAQHGLKTDRIGAVGVSAGGYGVCMLGTTGPSDGFDTPGEDPAASRVQAVVALGAPVDWTAPIWSKMVERQYLRPYLGKTYSEDPDLYTRASPGTYATADDPPFLLIHSVDDQLIPIAQAHAFAVKLRRANVPVEIVEETGAEHVWGGERLEKTLTTVVQFLDRTLRR
ncbi:alpha beta hydrolase : Esterase/lipase OS=Sporomusa ovata DSM 2662 GN=SOV_4c07280 PE=4 SV=1: Abhydrolase_5 [Gemmata massiliana]|uniref:BD-FAE-like domain-containing protein n=1 Tax=Gemmata massiliana TaxID=1210884 RepID=A0A6P2D8K7_9BACT|nr:alpha/beta hydrolase [Gemmata massiliana]VTR96484.1 alpha beta hydrolase : Esterase/lipase OS=Sporomusa ovata DSM 2662 GN=SOV_4c07280 PE=4 SV=1: Abhydrolase_5 [Gemmata massiliana]